MENSYFIKELYLIITTESDKKKAYDMADILLRKKLIACVTFKNIESHFWWRGDINKCKEVQLTIKCKEDKINEVYNNILINHSYEIPEIICLKVSSNEKYYNWVDSL